MKVWHWLALALVAVALAAFIQTARAGAPGFVPLVQEQVSRVVDAFARPAATPAPRMIEFCCPTIISRPVLGTNGGGFVNEPLSGPHAFPTIASRASGATARGGPMK